MSRDIICLLLFRGGKTVYTRAQEPKDDVHICVENSSLFSIFMGPSTVKHLNNYYKSHLIISQNSPPKKWVALGGEKKKGGREREIWQKYPNSLLKLK